jgi:hypothetical protein
MTAHFDHEAILRAHLRAAANSFEPSDDGLERIRARLRQPRSVSARLRAAYTEIVMRTPTLLQDMVYQLADWLRLAAERFAPTQTPGRHRSRTQGLLRPLAAMAVVMFIVAAGTYVAIDASTSIFPSSSSNAPSGGGPNAGGHSGAAANGSSHASGARGPAGTGSRPAVGPSCKSTSPKVGTTTSAPPPAPSASPSDSPSPTDSSTSTDTSPAPTDTSTDSPPPSAAPSAAPPPATTSPDPGLVPKPSPTC